RPPPRPPPPPSPPRARRPARPLREGSALLRLGRRCRSLPGAVPRLWYPVRLRRLLRRAPGGIPLVARQSLRRLLALRLRLQRLRIGGGSPPPPPGGPPGPRRGGG